MTRPRNRSIQGVAAEDNEADPFLAIRAQEQGNWGVRFTVLGVRDGDKAVDLFHGRSRPSSTKPASPRGLRESPCETAHYGTKAAALSESPA